MYNPSETVLNILFHLDPIEFLNVLQQKHILMSSQHSSKYRTRRGFPLLI